MAEHATSPESWIADRLSGPQQKFQAFANRVYQSGGALDLKTKELIAIATASVGRCPHYTSEHLTKAKEAGATEDEIAEALAVAWVQGGGTQLFWMKDDFEEFLGANWRTQFIPEVDRAFWTFKREVFAEGALSEKTKQLIAIAANSMLRCRHCTRAHIQAALKVGATRQEIAEALAVLWVIGSGIEVVWNQQDFETHLRTHTPT